MNKKINDINFGLWNEKKLQKALGDEWKKTKNQYETFDFIHNDGRIIELKSRRCSKDKYEETFFTSHKIKSNDTKKLRIYFLFTDGLYKWNYNPNQYRIASGGRNDRGRDEINEYCYVNKKYLKLKCKNMSSIEEFH